jgi:hypothetical protein
MDYAKRPLNNTFDLSVVYEKYYRYLIDNRDSFPAEYFDKYALEFL